MVFILGKGEGMTSSIEPLSVLMAKKIEFWPVEKLAPYEGNARTHSPEQVEQIAASIIRFGFVNPVLVDSGDGVIAGHGRLMAAKTLTLETVPVIVLDHLSDAEKRALVIADNKIAENAGWDFDKLAEELEALNDDGFDLTITGFTDEELEELLDGLDEPPEQSSPQPDPMANRKTISIDGEKVVVTDDECNWLLLELEQFIDGFGSTYGFVDHLRNKIQQGD